mmetsp:Transcript_25971/g.37240  ORF Transcript_25971/g.37240 Transcript_25971/m.37240 type:complete len:87 (-) Transcript_25971:299-559(-)
MIFDVVCFLLLTTTTTTISKRGTITAHDSKYKRTCLFLYLVCLLFHIVQNVVIARNGRKREKKKISSCFVIIRRDSSANQQDTHRS